MKGKREIGFEYEEKARKFLVMEGLVHIESNFCTKYGEIDLIFLDKDREILVFVEVKYRKNNIYGEVLEMVNKRKQEKIILTSQIFLDKMKWKENIRYDVIGICREKFGKESISWIKNAF